MVQYYTRGPAASWDWPGRMEVDTATNTIIYMPAYPSSNGSYLMECDIKEIDGYLNYGSWARVIPDHLVVSPEL